MDHSEYQYSLGQVMLMNQLQKLWEQHVHWTRSFIISNVAALADLDVVTKRLLRNPADFANLLGRFYGIQTADKFKNLFTQHLLIAADLVNAAKNNTAEVGSIRQKWYDNADEISIFLAGINPYWNEEEWKELLYSHLRMTEVEALQRIAGNYQEDVKIYDDIEDEALKMADYMSYGIINQYSVR